MNSRMTKALAAALLCALTLAATGCDRGNAPAANPGGAASAPMPPASAASGTP